MLEKVKKQADQTLFIVPVAAAVTYFSINAWYTRNQKIIVEAPHIRQYPELPRGCEVTSLTMLLQHTGIQADKVNLANQIVQLPFEEDGLHGNMNNGFVGDMYAFNKPGLGVYVQPIYHLACKYLQNRLVNITGGSPDDIYNMIDKGSPVWTIVNDTFAPLPEERWETWYTNDGPMRVTYAQHSVLVTGYSKRHVFVNDPLYDTPNRRLDRKKFEEAWIQMGRQALSYKQLSIVHTNKNDAPK